MLTIAPPFGYGPLVPVSPREAVRLPSPDFVAPAFARSQFIPLSVSEVVAAAAHYPIVFLLDGARQGYTLVALVGLQPESNLFCRWQDGWRWDPDAYVPEYVRRFPFCLSTVAFDGEVQPQRLVCVQASETGPARAPGLTALFDADGRSTDAWEQRLRALHGYEADLQATQALVGRLQELGLLQPMDATVASHDGRVNVKLVGLHAVDEQRLGRLADEAVLELYRSGQLARLHLHLFSLRRFDGLLARQRLALDVARPGVARPAVMDSVPPGRMS